MKIWAPLCFLAVAFAQDDDERKKLTEAEKVNIFKLNTVTSATRTIFLRKIDFKEIATFFEIATFLRKNLLGSSAVWPYQAG